jgi:putative transposase
MSLGGVLLQRHSIRLKYYDYSSAGAYFISICTKNRVCLFGEIRQDKIELNEYGEIARDEWIKSAKIRSEIELDEYVVMPNHFHAIAWINHEGDRLIGKGDRPVARTDKAKGPVPQSIGALMAGFKSAVTKHINEIRHTPGVAVWQRNYYEHIIRADDELLEVRQYILANPAKWALDRENPEYR